MAERIRQFTAEMTLNVGVSEEAVKEVEAQLQVSLPADYLDFLRSSNGAEGPIGQNGYLVLWPLEDVPLRNMELSVDIHLPNSLSVSTMRGIATRIRMSHVNDFWNGRRCGEIHHRGWAAD